MAFALFWAGCTSTTENEGGTAGSGAAAGAGGGSGFDACLAQCGTSADATEFKKQLQLCACVTKTSCEAECQSFCPGALPTLACVKCPDPAKDGCLMNNCKGGCDTYRTCLATCIQKL